MLLIIFVLSYRLEFSTKSSNGLRPHYHSSSTLKSVKSTSKSREEGIGGGGLGGGNTDPETEMAYVCASSGFQTSGATLFTDPSVRRFSSGHVAANHRVSWEFTPFVKNVEIIKKRVLFFLQVFCEINIWHMISYFIALVV